MDDRKGVHKNGRGDERKDDHMHQRILHRPFILMSAVV